MYQFIKKDRWPPYLVGFLIGVLLAALLTYGYQIGVSSGISRIAAVMENELSPDSVAKGSYFEKLLGSSPVFDWKILFIIGLFLGAYLASKVSQKPSRGKNTIWKEALGSSPIKRYAVSFLGGVLLMIGARFADGCTSGHAISGGAQLSITSWIFMLSVFTTAIPTAFFLYGKTRSL